MGRKVNRSAGVVLALGLWPWAGVARAAPSATEPQARAAALTTPAERRLHLAGAEASSYLVNDWNKFQENYLPQYVGDDDPRTAWNDGVNGDGVGEWLRVRFTPMAAATRLRLRVRNGYQKSKKLFAANARVKDATIKLLPGGKTVKVALADQWDYQDVVVVQDPGPLDGVEIRVDAVHPGARYDDVCVSDVQVFVTATTPENPGFEKLRFEKLRAWKAERLAAARLFKSKAGAEMPLASQYRAVPDAQAPPSQRQDCDGPACWMAAIIERAGKDPGMVKHAEALALARELTRGGFATMKPVQVISQDRRRFPAVDGLCRIGLDACLEDQCMSALPLPVVDELGFLNAAQLSTLGYKDPPAFGDVSTTKVRVCQRRQITRFAWVLRAPAADGGPGAIRALLVALCGMVEGREGYYPAARSQLLVYGPGGRLELSIDEGKVAAYDWSTEGERTLLAGGRQVNDYGPPTTFEPAVSVARR